MTVVIKVNTTTIITILKKTVAQTLQNIATTAMATSMKNIMATRNMVTMMTTTPLLSFSSAWDSSFATSWRPLCTKLYSKGSTNLDMDMLFQIKCYSKKM